MVAFLDRGPAAAVSVGIAYLVLNMVEQVASRAAQCLQAADSASARNTPEAPALADVGR